jgi:hypothetical protein
MTRLWPWDHDFWAWALRPRKKGKAEVFGVIFLPATTIRTETAEEAIATAARVIERGGGDVRGCAAIHIPAGQIENEFLYMQVGRWDYDFTLGAK